MSHSVISACPVGPEDRTGVNSARYSNSVTSACPVGPEDRTGVSSARYFKLYALCEILQIS